MPEFAEVADGCRSFVSSYFSCGFTKEMHLLDRLESPDDGIGRFLLVCILALAAPFTESLIRRYDGALRASEFFAAQARALALREQYSPNIENTQAFFLLGIYEWAHGCGQLGWMQMGIAVRMAGILKLHRESTYDLPDSATAEERIASESARRTCLFMDSKSRADRVVLQLMINTSLPEPHVPDHSTYQISVCVFRVVKKTSASAKSLHNARFWQTRERPKVMSIWRQRRTGRFTPQLSKVTLLRNRPAVWPLKSVPGDNLFGHVSVRACRSTNELDRTRFHAAPWEASSDYQSTLGLLRQWEKGLPPSHKWSRQNLRRYKAQNLDVGFCSATTPIRLSNVLLRRTYLPQMTTAAEIGLPLAETSTEEHLPSTTFFLRMADEMYQNAHDLLVQLEAFIELRASTNATIAAPPPFAFAAFVCGDLFDYLARCPQLCPRYSKDARTLVESSLRVLDRLTGWVLAKRWGEVLRRTIIARVRGPHNLAEATVEDQRPAYSQSPHQQGYHPGSYSSLYDKSAQDKLSDLATIATWRSSRLGDSWSAGDAMNSSASQPHLATDALLSEDFGLDLSAFLGGEDPLLSSTSWSMD
ncbi:hypothetical protein PV08_00690 [Exophiala spinifera]|uniref:Xylanolytic transcriptional activator regulatory domain-containing protein n=1 Tax=Exophiala spinifera TaxID=91928 RepID=A0A0D2BNK8_9EURO|nr:uncharacterized protein PV08_00690 [Exophiala spinifera]KIW20115.1 hypothetical protein PV08_00690 [Exophiala spinifera]